MRLRNLLAASAIGAAALVPTSSADAGGECRAWVANNAAHASCTWGTGKLVGLFVNRLGVPYTKSKVVYMGTGTAHVYPNSGGRTIGATVQV